MEKDSAVVAQIAREILLVPVGYWNHQGFVCFYDPEDFRFHRALFWP